MNTQEAYNNWAKTYDTVENRTRDLEEIAAKKVLENISFSKVLEIGCGTGKNTLWLADKASNLVAVDFSEEMLQAAKSKIKNENVNFQQADITMPWSFEKKDLITCSLILEHIENIDFIFKEASNTLIADGYFYICELHPFKQLQGSQANFIKDGTSVKVEYFIHHISDFCACALANSFTCVDLKEWFDDNNRATIPRLVSFLFKKNETE
ncbi:MAG: class I SAM-dependent methyltransferase [Chitinophagaceae bacterium]